MALRNRDILSQYSESTTIQKEFSLLPSVKIDTKKINSYYSNYNKSELNFKLKTPDSKIRTNNVSLFLQRTVEDTKRIVNFLKTGDGVLFLLKQTGLQLMNPNTEFIGALNRNRIYNPLSVLLNVVGNPVGLRTSRSFVPNNQYETVVNTLNLEGNNRLLKVYNELKYNELENTETPTLKLKSLISDTTNRLSNTKLGAIINDRFKVNGQPILTLSRIGGPKSIFGIGITNIRQYTNGQDSPLKYIDASGNETYYPNRNENTKYIDSIEDVSPLVAQYNHLYVDNNLQPGESTTHGNPITSVNLSGLNDFQTISEFEKNKYGFNNFESPEYFDKINDQFKYEAAYKNKYNDNENYYENWNFYRRLNIPINKPGSTDLINEILDANTLQNYEIISQDFIKLKIGSIQFRCIMTGLTDTFSPDKSPTRYIGRPDDVFTYTGVSRSISFNLIVYAFSVKEMKGIYDKLNKLAQYVSPIVNNGLMTGQVINLKIGDWFSTKQPVTSSEQNTFKNKETELENKYQNNEEVLNRLFPNKDDKTISGFSTLSNRGLPVIIDTLSYTIDDNYTWDILMELPKTISISLGFTVIDNESPNSNKIYFGDGLMNG